MYMHDNASMITVSEILWLWQINYASSTIKQLKYLVKVMVKICCWGGKMQKQVCDSTQTLV